MKACQWMKKWLTDGCVYFTVTILIMLVLNFLFDGSMGIDPMLFWIYPFGLCMSAAELLLHSKYFISSVRYLLHFVITMLSLFLLLYLPSGASVKPSTTLILFVLFSICYWIIMGIILLIRARVRKLMQEN